MQPDDNPFQPPAAPDEGDGHQGSTLASRWARLAAQFIDGLVLLMVYLPVASYGMGIDFAAPTDLTLDQEVLMSVVGLCVYLLLNSYLWYHRSMSIGKALLGLRIETLDGKRAGFGRIVGARVLPGFAIGLLPFGQAFAYLDALFIFRGDRRCVHDLIAGTRVVKLGRTARV